MAKKKAEKEPKAEKTAKAAKKEPKPKKKKGKGKDAESAPEAAAAVEAAENAETAEAAENAENTEADGKEEKKKKSGRSILEPILCVMIALLVVVEIALVYLWLTTPSQEEILAQLEAQTVHETWSAASYANWHGTYRPSDIPAPVAAYATSNDVPATARPASGAQTDAATVPTV